MDKAPTVSIIIPHLNDHERLAICLALLQRQSYPAGKIEIVVVDNGSQTPIDPVIAAFPGVRGAFEREKGCGTARNRGVAVSSGEILAFTDSDCRPDPDWVANAVKRLTGPDAPDIVGGDIHVFAADEAHPTDAELYDKVFGFQQEWYVRAKHFAAGANIVTTRRAFGVIGPFLNGRQPEDVEWGHRARAKGLKLAFAPDALVRHPARYSWEDLRWKMDRTIFHQRNSWRTKSFFFLRWLALLCVLALPPLLKTRTILASPHLKDRGQRQGALAILFRLRYHRVRMVAQTLFDDAPLGQFNV